MSTTLPPHLPGWNYWRIPETGKVYIMLSQDDLIEYVALAKQQPGDVRGWEVVNSQGERIGPLYAQKSDAEVAAATYYANKIRQNSIPYQVRALINL